MAHTEAARFKRAINSQTQSPLFKLSAHLRRTIFKLAFLPAQEPEDMIDLIELTPPEPDLLRVCQRIHAESQSLFVSAASHYWHQDFYIDVITSLDSVATFAHVSDRTLRKISSLTFVPPRYNPGKAPRVVITTVGGTYHYSQAGPGRLSELESIMSIKGVVDKANERGATARELYTEMNTMVRMHSTWGWTGGSGKPRNQHSTSRQGRSKSLFE